MTFPAKLKFQFLEMLNRNKISFSQGWSNFMETVKNPAAVVVDVDSEEQVQLIMKAVKRLNQGRTSENKITLRATSGWENENEGCCFFPWMKVQEEEYGKGLMNPLILYHPTDRTKSHSAEVIQ